MTRIVKRDNLSILGMILLSIVLLQFIIGCSEEQQGGFAPPPTPIEVADVNQSGVVDKFNAVGTVNPAEGIIVAVEINAIVKELPFAEGESIAKGGLIAQLDDAQAKAAYASAKATMDQAKVSYDRTKEIVGAKAAAQQDLDDATARLKVAEANLEQARVALEKTSIRAPFSGTLGTRRVSPGAYLRAGDAITTLTQIRKLKIMFSVPERVLPSLRVGAHVEVSSPAYPDERLDGTISVIDPVINESTRTVQVIALVDNERRLLRPGMSADVSVVLSERPDALTVSDEAVFAEGNQNFVYLINPDSTVVKTAISLGSRQTGTVEITHGLKADQQVVRAGHQKLYDGAKVMSVQSGPPEEQQQDQPVTDSTTGEPPVDDSVQRNR